LSAKKSGDEDQPILRSPCRHPPGGRWIAQRPEKDPAYEPYDSVAVVAGAGAQNPRGELARIPPPAFASAPQFGSLGCRDGPKTSWWLTRARTLVLPTLPHLCGQPSSGGKSSDGNPALQVPILKRASLSVLLREHEPSRPIIAALRRQQYRSRKDFRIPVMAPSSPPGAPFRTARRACHKHTSALASALRPEQAARRFFFALADCTFAHQTAERSTAIEDRGGKFSPLFFFSPSPPRPLWAWFPLNNSALRLESAAQIRGCGDGADPAPIPSQAI